MYQIIKTFNLLKILYLFTQYKSRYINDKSNNFENSVKFTIKIIDYLIK